MKNEHNSFQYFIQQINKEKALNFAGSFKAIFKKIIRQPKKERGCLKDETASCRIKYFFFVYLLYEILKTIVYIFHCSEFSCKIRISQIEKTSRPRQNHKQGRPVRKKSHPIEQLFVRHTSTEFFQKPLSCTGVDTLTRGITSCLHMVNTVTSGYGSISFGTKYLLHET